MSLYNQTDTFILGFIDSTKAEVGSYSVGIKGIDIIIGIITALSTVFIPRSAYYYSKEDKRFFKNLTKYSINICLFIVLPAVATMTVLAQPICGLICGNYNFANAALGYNDAPWVLITVCSMMVTFSLSDIIYGQILLPTKKENHYLFAILAGIYAQVVEFAQNIRMVPLQLHKEKNGYILNSMLVPFLFAGLDLFATGVSDPETIDKT